MPNSIGHHGANGHLPCDRCTGKQYNVCHLLEPARQRELLDTSCRHRWDKREYLFRAGSAVGAVFKVTSGIVAESRTLADGRRQIIAFFLPGDICGYLESDGRHAFDGEAITTAETCSFNRERFSAFVNRNNDVAEEMRRNLADRLKMAGAHLSVVGQLTSTERVANFVAMMTTAYAARNVQTRPLPLPMKRSDIADYLGLRLETVSRAFSKLRQHNIIDVNEDEVLILDQAKLNQLSNR
ncbi:MAG TPA: Crp/Fnr family transcriptional regulator [Reyranella sp.]|jgi:CRP/FNR family transcriptional regulator|nr:Crp/Fnr family transcriptional regulator [Reyranella sp.]